MPNSYVEMYGTGVDYPPSQKHWQSNIRDHHDHFLHPNSRFLGSMAQKRGLEIHILTPTFPPTTPGDPDVSSPQTICNNIFTPLILCLISWNFMLCPQRNFVFLSLLYVFLFPWYILSEFLPDCNCNAEEPSF